jgi:tetratricopeptide (TPR) repeat protein
MVRLQRQFLFLFLSAVVCAFTSLADDLPPAQRPWVEVSTAHFEFYSCGPIGSVYKLAGRLEQFSSAYAQLAGAQAVASPPIVVIVFPDRQTMEPFLPVYNGHPATIAAFFHHGIGENIIVLSLPEPGYRLNLDVIFHEYAHFLFQRNDNVWPLWLKEGIAEMYSTFETSGHTAQIGAPIPHHLRVLADQPLMPLEDLFSVKPDSPAYNEQQRQGMFYAESWLLTHFLMAGDVPGYISRFGQFTTLLRQGQLPTEAFTNALETPLPAMEAQLQRYLQRGQFRTINLAVSTNLSAPIASKVRTVGPAEACFRLGDELLLIGRLDDAEPYFDKAHDLAPASPLPEEGLGLLAARRGQTDEALQHLQAAMARGSGNFLVYYAYARDKYHATADAEGRLARLADPEAGEIRQALQRSIALMPTFAPAHELLGFFEMIQGDDLAVAGQQIQYAIQLAPDNQSYLISLAQLDIRMQNPDLARQTLQPLLRPNVADEVRTLAQKILAEINSPSPPPPGH